MAPVRAADVRLKEMFAFILAVLLFASPAYARDAKQVRAFRAAHPCPATGKPSGPCPGWVVDHVVPLCLGGADTPANMQWQERQESLKKDVLEWRACALKVDSN